MVASCSVLLRRVLQFCIICLMGIEARETVPETTYIGNFKVGEIDSPTKQWNFATTWYGLLSPLRQHTSKQRVYYTDGVGECKYVDLSLIMVWTELVGNISETYLTMNCKLNTLGSMWCLPNVVFLNPFWGRCPDILIIFRSNINCGDSARRARQ